MIVESKEEYEVEDVLNSRVLWRKLEYLDETSEYPQPDWMSTQDINERAVMNIFHILYHDNLGTL